MKTAILILSLACCTVLGNSCGMVPSVILTAGTPELMRSGNQLTYGFFKDGIEDIALRPGPKGKFANFGMLIPFPAGPEIRKVPDNIFPHIERAIYPPQVVIDLCPKLPMLMLSADAPEDIDNDELVWKDQV